MRPVPAGKAHRLVEKNFARMVVVTEDAVVDGTWNQEGIAVQRGVVVRIGRGEVVHRVGMMVRRPHVRSRPHAASSPALLPCLGGFV